MNLLKVITQNQSVFCYYSIIGLFIMICFFSIWETTAKQCTHKEMRYNIGKYYEFESNMFLGDLLFSNNSNFYWLISHTIPTIFKIISIIAIVTIIIVSIVMHSSIIALVLVFMSIVMYFLGQTLAYIIEILLFLIVLTVSLTIKAVRFCKK